MNPIPENRKYALTHEWAKPEENEMIRVGISDFAQTQLGDVVFVDLPNVGQAVFAGQACATIESVKTASDIHSPVTGEIVSVNESLQNEPEQINDDAYKAWLFCIKMTNPSELNNLLDASNYQNHIDA